MSDLSLVEAPVESTGMAGAAPLPTAGSSRAELHHIAAFTALEHAAAAWDHLQSLVSMSPYQRRDWLTAWFETIGRGLGLVPAILVGYDGANRPLVLLPFGTRRQGGATIGRFLGGRESNFNLGLFDPAYDWDRAAIERVLREGARLAEPRIDVFVLHNQPLAWDDRANPLASLPHRPSPSFGYSASLHADPEAFLDARLSREARRKLRQKTKWLGRLGAVRHERATTAQARAAAIAAYLDQRAARAAAIGLPAVDSAALRRFLETATRPNGESGGDDSACVEIHALWCGPRIVATFFAALHQGRCSGMFTSFAPEPEWRKTSPGDILLAAVVADQCRRGCRTFDLGIGEARYKDSYCPEVEPLCDTIVPISVVGTLFGAIEAMRLVLKRIIKQSPRLWALARRLRRSLVRHF